MAQIFSQDARVLGGNLTITDALEHAGPITNFLTIPFTNAKGVGIAVMYVQPSAGGTGLQIRIRRNPNAENVVVADSTVFSAGVVGNSQGTYSLGFVDPIPDNRAVQYEATVLVAGGGASSFIFGTSYIEATVLSG